MSAPIKVTDLVAKSLDELAKSNSAQASADIARFERNARVYADLAGVQSAKTANIISYLNSDRSKWSDTDEEVVRVMLGLHSLDGGETDGEGGEDTVLPGAPDRGPLPASEPTPVADPEPAVEAISVPGTLSDEPVFVADDVEEPTFA